MMYELVDMEAMGPVIVDGQPAYPLAAEMLNALVEGGAIRVVNGPAYRLACESKWHEGDIGLHGGDCFVLVEVGEETE